MDNLPDWPDLGKRHLAILGMNGSGKTSTAKTAIVEPVLRNRQRAVIIDPTGVWYGLRLDREGKPSGYNVYVFGGDHGDMPLRARDAGILAEAFGTSSNSAVFDTSHMSVSERMAFFTDFAGAIMRKNRGPLHLVIDEAHLFMPQAGVAGGGQAPAMLHAGNNLVSLGRSRGLRVTMITQRPAKLHKDALTQAQALIAMRVMAPQDRKAVGEWIAEQADPAKGREITESLSSLKAGEAWVWAPGDAFLERIRFPLPETYDSSRAPDDGDGHGLALPPLSMDALKGRLATIEADVKDSDPKALKAMVATLKRQLAEQPAGVSEAEIDAAFAAGRAEGVRIARDILADALDDCNRTLFAPTPPGTPAKAVQPPPPVRATVAPAPAPRPASAPPPARGDTVFRTARAILEVIHGSYPIGLSFDAAARRAGASKRSSAYRTYRSEIMGSGEVEGTAARIVSLPQFAAGEAIPPGAALEAWAARLSPSMGKMLRAIADGHGHKQMIARAAGISETSSGLSSGLRELCNLELIELNGGIYQLAEGLK